MVSIENKATYQLRINESPKLTAFNNLLLNKTALHPKQDLNESEQIYFGIINAIQTNDKSEFETHYSKKKRSNPSKESPSPFVNDDFLIFCFIVGIVKFDSDKSWIRNIISIRTRSSITITLENILNENYLSKSNLPELVLIFFHLNKQELITNQFINTTFKSLSENESLFENKSDFQILCSVRAYDLIIELKEAPEGSEVKLLMEFNEKFISRMKALSWIVQTIVMIAFLFGLIKLFSYLPQVKDFFVDYDPIFGVLGLSILGNFIPVIKKIFYEVLLRIFGYPKEMIKILNSKEK